MLGDVLIGGTARHVLHGLLRGCPEQKSGG
jgi:hypothetical protein